MSIIIINDGDVTPKPCVGCDSSSKEDVIIDTVRNVLLEEEQDCVEVSLPIRQNIITDIEYDRTNLLMKEDDFPLSSETCSPNPIPPPPPSGYRYHNELQGIQGGNPSERWHLDYQRYLASLNANNPSEGNPFATLLDLQEVNLENYYTKEQLQQPGQSIVHWDNISDVPDLTVSWQNIQGDQSNVEVGGFSNTIGYITLDDIPPVDLSNYVTFGENISVFSNNMGYITLSDLPTPPVVPTSTSDLINNGEDGINPYITALDLPNLSNYIQQGDSNTVLINTAGYITIDDIPAQVNADWNATSGVSQILNKPTLATVATTGNYADLTNQPIIPDLTGYATESWVTSQNYLTSVTSSWDINSGDLVIQGETRNLDGRYMLRSNTITSGYGITTSANFNNPVSIEVNTSVLDNRYLRKDVNDNNDTFGLTLGTLSAGDTTLTGSVTISSVPVGTGDEVLLYGAGGVVQRKTLSILGAFGVANSAGTKQFDVNLGDNLRFQGAGDTSISYNPSTNTVIINSVPGSGTGGAVTSFNGRDGAVNPELGDYTTSIVGEGTNLYFTNARVLATTLAGFSATNSAISASDTVLSAFGKAQGQISARALSATTMNVQGTAGNITVSGGAQSLAANRTWTVNLASVGTAGTYTKVTTDAQGRVTAGAALTLADLPNIATQRILGRGATGSGNIQELTLGANLSLSTAGVLSATNTNTTYSAGAGLTLSGTTFSLPVTVSGSGTYVQSVAQNTNGITVTLGTPPNTTYSNMSLSELNTGTVTTARSISAKTLSDWIAGKLPTVNNGTLSMSTGTGLSGSASFSANQSGNSSFTVSAASGYVIPTTTQRNNWNVAYDERITNVTGGLGGRLTLTKPSGTDISTTIKSIASIDTRTGWSGSTGDQGYMPAPNNSDLNNSLSLNFVNGDWGSTGWGSVITAKGWSTSYGAWQIGGPANQTAQGQDLYLRTGLGATWNSWRKIWHDGNFTPSNYQTTITGGATTIVSSNLTASRALISNGSGKVAVSAVTSTELGYLDGVTSAIQTQLNGKAPTSHTHTWSQLSGGSTALIPGAGSSTTYGSLNISGSKAAYSGINFVDADNSILMVNNTTARSGLYKGSWVWAFEGNGTLYAGTVPWARLTGYPSITAGNGLTGGGSLNSTKTISLATPGTLTSTSTNSVTTSSHTHALGDDVWGSTAGSLSGNLNDYTVAGHRSQATAANATLANNYPWEGGGGSLINSGGSGTYRTQIFHNRGGTQIAWRARTSGSTWSTWKEFWHSNNFNPSNYTPTSRTITLTGGTGITSSVGEQSLAANRTWTISLNQATATVRGGIELFSNTVQSVAANSVTATAGRTYGIQLNSAGQAVVNVPWTNTNTTYTAGNGLSLSGTTFSVGASTGITVNASNVALTSITAGSGTVGALRYNGTTRVAGQMYGGTSNPVSTTRLNYDGILHVTDYISYGASDLTLKENLTVISNPLEKLKSINGYKFNWKEGHSSYSGSEYGVIAQELQKILPEAVIRRGDGILAINGKNSITALLIEAVKELSREVEALKNGIS